MSTGLPAHPKTKKLLKRLGYAGAWHLVKLFLWVAQNRPDGDLAGLDDESIELAIDWCGETGALAVALADVGFLDGPAGSRRIHDWEVHNPWAAGAPARSAQAKHAVAAREAKRRLGGETSQVHLSDHLNSKGDHLTPEADDRPRETGSSPLPLPPPVPKPDQAKKHTPHRRAKLPLPTGFGISSRVKEWAQARGYGDLEKRLEHFLGYAKRSGARYVDWDEAFMSAIREDWAKIALVRAPRAGDLAGVQDANQRASDQLRRERPDLFRDDAPEDVIAS